MARHRKPSKRGQKFMRGLAIVLGSAIMIAGLAGAGLMKDSSHVQDCRLSVHDCGYADNGHNGDF